MKKLLNKELKLLTREQLLNILSDIMLTSKNNGASKQSWVNYYEIEIYHSDKDMYDLLRDMYYSFRGDKIKTNEINEIVFKYL